MSSIKTDQEVTENIIKTIPYKARNEMENEYREQMNKHKDISIPCYEVSLVCPISQSRITRPVRGSQCQHLQSIEAYFFIKTGCVVIGNDVVLKVQCPICSTSYQNISELFIDGLQQEILQTHPNTDTITFKPDGTYYLNDNSVEAIVVDDIIDLTLIPDKPIFIDLT